MNSWRDHLRQLRQSPRVYLFATAALAATAALLAVPIARSAWHMSFAPLGRDPGIYQYVAWALSLGDRPYVDIRENNGPLVYLVHTVFLALGGENERVFRTLDLVSLSIAFAYAGVVAYGPWRRHAAEQQRVLVGGRVLFGALGVLVLLAQYFVFDWWATPQRESTYDAILLVGFSLQLRAHQRTGIAGVLDAGSRMLLASAGAFVAATWFGKPTYLACTLAQLACLFIDPATRRFWRASAVRVAAGSFGVAALFVGWVALRGSVVDYVRIVYVEAPRYYVPIWKQTLEACYTLGRNAPLVDRGAFTLLGLGLLTAVGFLPRSFVLVLWPVFFGLASFFAQRKGFLYHLHPVTSGAHWAWLVTLGWLADGLREPRRVRTTAFFGGLLAFVGWQCFGDGTMTEWSRGEWMNVARDPSTRATRAYLDHFTTPDFDGYDIRQTAAYLREHVPEGGTVQTYGLEPYVLFLAKRRSATPFLYLYDLNMEPALEGGPGGRPNEAQAAEIRRLQARNAQELARRLRDTPASAFVLIDEAPMAYAPDALADFRRQCPDAASLLDERYTESARFGKLRVFLPLDRDRSERKHGRNGDEDERHEERRGDEVERARAEP
jgi:hypothetical protein